MSRKENKDDSIKYSDKQIQYLRKRWESVEGKERRKLITQKIMTGDTDLGSLASFQDSDIVPKVPDGKDLRGIILSGYFPEGLDFSEFHFSGARIEASNLTDFDFSFAHLENISFRGSILNGSAFKGAYLIKPDFVGADLERISLSGSVLDDIPIISHKIFGENGFKDFKDSNGFIEKNYYIYSILKEKYRILGRYDEMIPFHLLEMRGRRDDKYINKKTKKKHIRWYFDLLGFDLLCGYGEKWQNALISAFVMIFLFTFLYMPFPLSNQLQQGAPADKFINYLYFSAVTFSNYGSQDFLPGCDYHRFILFIESLIGLFCVTIIVVIYSRKMIRE